MGNEPQVVILGCGFAGQGAAIKLKNAPVKITIIDQNDYHTFQPLLYQLATDEMGVTQVGFRALTGRPQDAATRAVDPAAIDRTEAFAFTVPASAVPGSTIAIEASAVDTRGLVTAAQPVNITVLDGTAPTAAITGVTTGERVRPGQDVTAVVSASDLGGIARIGFVATGAASLVEVREVSPVQNDVATAFTFRVSATALPTDRVTLDAYAIDRAGNRGDAARIILPVADQVPPTLQLRTSTGRLDIVPGQTVTVVATAADENAVSRIDLSGSGAFQVTTAQSISPPQADVVAEFTISVPPAAQPGTTLDLVARATDVSGNVSNPVGLSLGVIAVADVTMPASLIVLAGDTTDLNVSMSAPAPAGGLVVTLESANPAVASVAATVV